jgi:hypothetical protein
MKLDAIINPNAAHRYNVQVSASGDFITVDANNRNAAAAIAKKHGYAVWSVNMVG